MKLWYRLLLLCEWKIIIYAVQFLFLHMKLCLIQSGSVLRDWLRCFVDLICEYGKEHRNSYWWIVRAIMSMCTIFDMSIVLCLILSFVVEHWIPAEGIFHLTTCEVIFLFYYFFFLGENWESLVAFKIPHCSPGLSVLHYILLLVIHALLDTYLI